MVVGLCSRSALDTADALPVRWLADLCGLPLLGLSPRLASSLLANRSSASATASYLAWWARNAAPESNFKRTTRHLSDMTDSELVTALRSLRYDGLLYEEEGEFVGHVFFQRHGGDVCVFSLAVDERFRGRKLWATFSIYFVAFASSLSETKRARVGAGNHPITWHVLDLLAPHAGELGWKLSADGWIDFKAH